MGTRSTTKVFDCSINEGAIESKMIINMYRQYDGYVSEHGKELSEFLSSGIMVNGFTANNITQFNGMPCLAAQLVAHFKKGVGGFYLYPTNLLVDYCQEYEYFVYNDGIEVYHVYDGKTLPFFSGSYKEFADEIKNKTLDKY